MSINVLKEDERNILMENDIKDDQDLEINIRSKKNFDERDLDVLDFDNDDDNISVLSSVNPRYENTRHNDNRNNDRRNNNRHNDTNNEQDYRISSSNGDYEENDNYYDNISTRRKEEGPAEKRQKANFLCKIKTLDPKKEISFLDLDMESPLHEVENEFYRIEKQLELKNGMNFVKSSYIGAASFIEFMSTKQKLAAVNLSGWPYKVALESNEPRFEKVFGDIYEKYLTSIAEADPLLTLLGMTLISASQHHYSKNPMSNINNLMEEPDDDNLDDIVEKLNNKKNQKEEDDTEDDDSE